jgi:DNA-binding LacI/PurR family transcriptional regulator
LGIAVPEELSVTGFDDIPFAAFTRPPLTTIRQPRREMGREAMRLLFALLDGEEAQKTSVINGELIVRGSTAPLPR